VHARLFGRHHCILRDLRRTYQSPSANLREASGVRVTLRPRIMPFRGKRAAIPWSYRRARREPTTKATPRYRIRTQGTNQGEGDT
jgi:hypothetical protein